MKKLTLSLLIILVLTAYGVLPVQADGIIIIDPPPAPPPDWSPWLTIRYHRVTITIEDQVATTQVDQVFRNDSPIAAEGTYIFPLPPGAVVEQFLLWVDGKPLEGKILAADEARVIYEDYVRRQQDPALLEYIGRDAVQARIYPIPPGEERRIELTYREVLPLEQGLLHYRYPLNTERFSAQPLEQVSIHVEVSAQTPIRALYSSTHQDEVLIQRETERQATLSYEAHDIFPERDFELYAGFDEQDIGANLLTYRQGDEDGFFLLMLSPSLAAEDARIVPKDLLLVLDTSGSMEGDKLEQAQSALTYILRHLNPEDRFNVVAFSSDVRTYARDLRPVSEAETAAAWVTSLEALGGTNIYLALSAALDQVAATGRPTVLIFLTDGLPTEGIVEEDTLLAMLAEETSDSVRLFPFGVGYDVNTLFLDQLAADHKGRPAYVTPDERIDEQVSTFYARIQSPLLTDITLDFGNVRPYDLHPTPLPDLYAGNQLIVVGRYTGAGPQPILLQGTVGSVAHTYHYEDTFTTETGADFIPRLWAARKIGHLLTQIRLHGEQEEWVEAVVELSLRYGIITPYTSFLVEEATPLTSAEREKAADDFRAQPTPAASGQEAVEEAEQRLGLGDAQAPPPAMEWSLDDENIDSAAPSRTTLRYVGTQTFFCENDSCTDTTFVPDQMTARTLQFGSESYWQLLTDHPEWSAYLAVAPDVTFVAQDGTAIHIQPGADIVEDELPLPAPQPQEPTPTLSTPLPTPIPVPGGSSLCSGPLALILFVLFLSCLILRR